MQISFKNFKPIHPHPVCAHGLWIKFKLLCLVYKALYELVIDIISKHIPQKVGNQALSPIANGRINW